MGLAGDVGSLVVLDVGVHGANSILKSGLKKGKGYHNHSLEHSENRRYAKYKVTGKYYNSKKNFAPIYTDNLSYAQGINTWRGTVWKKQSNGKYKELQKTYNV